MFNNLLITGGQERENGFDLGEGKYYKKAFLMKLNINTGLFENILSFSEEERGENYPDKHPNIQYTAGCVENDKLWLSTDTEVMLYKYPEMQLLIKKSHPAFHNIHHVQMFDDYLAVVSTGLDMIILLSKDKLEPIRYINAEGKNPWYRFSPDYDYRKIHSTRPHSCHPNYVFKLRGDLWATRCTQEDAVNLNDFSKIIEIAPSRSISVHDGHVVNERIYFTTVDGFIIIIDSSSLKIVEEIDLGKFESKKSAKGWCRGIHIDGDIIYVGFSRIRKTKSQEKIAWVKNKFTNQDTNTTNQGNAVVAAYHLRKKQKINEWVFPNNSIDAIYSLLPEPKIHIDNKQAEPGSGDHNLLRN